MGWTAPFAFGAPHRSFYGLVSPLELGLGLGLELELGLELAGHFHRPVRAHMLCLMPPRNSSFLVLEKKARGEQPLTLECLAQEMCRDLQRSLEQAPGRSAEVIFRNPALAFRTRRRGNHKLRSDSAILQGLPRATPLASCSTHRTRRLLV